MEPYTYLIFTILATTGMMVALRETRRRELDLYQVTTFNYFTAASLGLIFSPDAYGNVIHSPAFRLALLMGASFITVFLVMGAVTKIAGITYMAFLGKMALMLPVIYSWYYYGEELTALRIAGIALALVAVAMISVKSKEAKQQQKSEGVAKGKLGGLLVLSVVLFFGNGWIDCLFKTFTKEYGGKVSDVDFAIVVFTIAGTLGLTLVIARAIKGVAKIRWQNLAGGVLVGLPNYFSLVCLTIGLQYLEGTVFFPVNNIGILLLAALSGFVLFRERFTWLNYAGMGVAIASIWLMV